LKSVLFFLLAYSLFPAEPSLAREAARAGDPSLVTIDLRYPAPPTHEIFLVWGLNGWSVVPEAVRPAGTFVERVMHTPMIREGETFMAKIRVPPGATLDYGFEIRTRRDDGTVQSVWDGDHHRLVSEDDRLEIKPAVTSPPASSVQAEPRIVTQEVRYHVPEAGEVELIWGINGWSEVPKAKRPDGTKVDVKRLMHTPMKREDDVFVVKVQVPVGSILNYGFQITRDERGEEIWAWDGDYSARPTEDGSIDATSSLALVTARNVLETMSVLFTCLAALIVVWGCWIAVKQWVHLPVWLRQTTLVALVNISLIAFLLVMGETYLRWKGLDRYVRTYPGGHHDNPRTEGRWQRDEILGWVGGSKNTDINRQGFRDQKDFDRVDHSTERIRVMILGDSFMWGTGVASSESVPGLLQSWTSDTHSVFNLGVPGWGIDQMYLAYQRYKDKLSPHIVILTFIDDDILRVLEAYRKWEGLNKPSFEVHEGRLRSRLTPSRMQLWLDDTMGGSVLFGRLLRDIYLLADAGPVVRYLLEDMVRDTEQRKARLAILRIPTRDSPNGTLTVQFTVNHFKQALRDTGALYLDPTEQMSRVPEWTGKFYLNDPGRHLSLEGNQYVAHYVRDHVLKTDQAMQASSRRH
jgi:hypothetical protein